MAKKKRNTHPSSAQVLKKERVSTGRPQAQRFAFKGQTNADPAADRICPIGDPKGGGQSPGKRPIIDYRFRISILVLSPLNKQRFVRWALKGLRFRRSPTAESGNAVAAKST